MRLLAVIAVMLVIYGIYMAMCLSFIKPAFQTFEKSVKELERYEEQ